MDLYNQPDSAFLDEIQIDEFEFIDSFEDEVETISKSYQKYCNFIQK
jgi:hypothetical protein